MRRYEAEPICRKCGGNDIHWERLPNNETGTRRWVPVDERCPTDSEHLCMTCRRCGWKWCMALYRKPRSEPSQFVGIDLASGQARTAPERCAKSAPSPARAPSEAKP